MNAPPPIILSAPETVQNATTALLLKELQDYDRRIHAFRYRWWAWPAASALGFFIVGFLCLAYNPYPSTDDRHSTFIGAMAFVGGGLALIAYGLGNFLIRKGLFEAKLRTEHQLARANTEQLKESIEDDFFTKLVKINFRYIDQYYFQTQQQANKSFLLSCVAAAVGFGIVILGIGMMFFGKTEPAYVTTGVGTLSEFVAAVFFYLYNRTILKMGEYHEKLVLTQNISVALKITEALPDAARVQSQQMLIERLTLDVNRYLSENHSREK